MTSVTSLKSTFTDIDLERSRRDHFPGGFASRHGLTRCGDRDVLQFEMPIAIAIAIAVAF